MKKAIIGKKVGMAQIFDENGKVIPVTVIEAGPCVVVQKKTAEGEGYDSVQLAFDDTLERKLTKGELGHLKKAGVAPKKVLKEFRLEDTASLSVGDVLKADVFAEGDRVDVTGITKVKATPALSNAGVSMNSSTPTALALFTVLRVPWAPTPTRPALCRARNWPVTSALHSARS